MLRLCPSQDLGDRQRRLSLPIEDATLPEKKIR
jgi:hypothetical protein